MSKHNMKPLNLALGAAFTVSLANVGVADAAGNPFSMQPLSSGYATLAEGKCGEGKCGGMGMGAAKKGAEGRCGMMRMDADGDGKVTKDEFMKGHEAKFAEIDKNSDGVIDQDERMQHMQQMRSYMQQWKSGPGAGQTPESGTQTE